MKLINLTAQEYYLNYPPICRDLFKTAKLTFHQSEPRKNLNSKQLIL